MLSIQRNFLCNDKTETSLPYKLCLVCLTSVCLSVCLFLAHSPSELLECQISSLVSAWWGGNSAWVIPFRVGLLCLMQEFSPSWYLPPILFNYMYFILSSEYLREEAKAVTISHFFPQMSKLKYSKTQVCFSLIVGLCSKTRCSCWPFSSI